MKNTAVPGTVVVTADNYEKIYCNPKVNKERDAMWKGMNQGSLFNMQQGSNASFGGSYQANQSVVGSQMSGSGFGKMNWGQQSNSLGTSNNASNNSSSFWSTPNSNSNQQNNMTGQGQFQPMNSFQTNQFSPQSNKPIW